MNMHAHVTLREAPIPPQAAEPPHTEEAAERIHAALLKLVWLALYLAVMNLLGYRFRRRRPATPTSAAAPPAAPPVPHPAAAPAAPRRQHLYLDRDAAIAMLAGINAACAATPPQPPTPPEPAPAPAPAPAPEPAPAPSPRALRPGASPIPPISAHPITLIPARRAARRPPPHPPPFKNARHPAAPTHARFITIP